MLVIYHIIVNHVLCVSDIFQPPHFDDNCVVDQYALMNFHSVRTVRKQSTDNQINSLARIMVMSRNPVYVRIP